MIGKNKYISAGVGVLFGLLAIISGLNLLHKGPGVVSKASTSIKKCDASTDCVFLTIPGNEGSYYAPYNIERVIFKSNKLIQAKESFVDKCYEVHVDGKMVNWRKLDSSPRCKDVNYIQIWTESPMVTPLPLPSSLLWLDPQIVNASMQEYSNVGAWIGDIKDVYGIQVTILYDPTKLIIEDQDLQSPGTQIRLGNCPMPDLVVRNNVDLGYGVIEYAATQLNPSPPCDGGLVAEVSLKCIGTETTSDILFSESIVSTRDGDEIHHSTKDAVVKCL